MKLSIILERYESLKSKQDNWTPYDIDLMKLMHSFSDEHLFAFALYFIGNRDVLKSQVGAAIGTADDQDIIKAIINKDVRVIDAIKSAVKINTHMVNDLKWWKLCVKSGEWISYLKKAQKEQTVF